MIPTHKKHFTPHERPALQRHMVASFAGINGVRLSMSKPNPQQGVSSTVLALCLALNASVAAAAAPAAATPAGPAAGAPAASPAAPAMVAPMTGQQVIQILDQTIDWYRTLGIQQQAASEPSDLLILYDNRQTANQVIGLAFELARANAEILAKQPQPKDTDGAHPDAQSLTQLQNKFAAQAAQVQAELDAARAQLAKARPAQKTDLQAKISELQGELELIDARQSLLSTMSSFSSQNDTNGFSPSALKAQIDAMAVTAPAAVGAPAGAATPAAPAPAATVSSNPASIASLTGASSVAAARYGIWDLAANVIRLSEKAASINAVDQRTAALQATFAQLRTPLISQLKGLSARGDALAAQADTADNAALKEVRDQLGALSNQFKQTSALMIPLSKEIVLLSQYRRNLGNWRDAVKNQYRNALKTLGVRVAVLAVLLAIVFAAAEVWRRAVLRYVQDSRRRYQFLLLRRIALWCLVVLIAGFAFASELGSIVTFAGLITAGLAVAMQSVLVSIVGYFFLIGKYGVRVGDRVQIGEVTGEVIDLGLVRMHLMELGGKGLSGPTGRVVAFANSIVFQVSSGLFKQMHGVNFVWREITLGLPAGIDFAAAKEKLSAAVTHVLKDECEEITRQSKEIQRATATSIGGDGQPRVQLSFAATGVDAHIRYPVHLSNAAEIEERVSQAVYAVLATLGAADSKAAAPT
jgi:small-conductance mechanosensitive channel